jgi:hypothetical protein
VADDEPVIAPDQLKDDHTKAFKIAGVLTMIALILMIWPIQEGHVEDWWLIGIAAAIGAVIVSDSVLRRRGLKR